MHDGGSHWRNGVEEQVISWSGDVDAPPAGFVLSTSFGWRQPYDGVDALQIVSPANPARQLVA